LTYASCDWGVSLIVMGCYEPRCSGGLTARGILARVREPAEVDSLYLYRLTAKALVPTGVSATKARRSRVVEEVGGLTESPAAARHDPATAVSA